MGDKNKPVTKIRALKSNHMSSNPNFTMSIELGPRASVSPSVERVGI